MKYFFSKETNGLYIDEIHGDLMPKDCVELTRAEYQAVCGKTLKAGANGKPVVTAPEETQEQKIMREIAGLEAQVTPRRIRDAIIGKDNGFVLDIENKIIALREKL